MLFEKALSSIGKENEELTKKYEKGVAEYKKAKETYNKLPENQREKWLKENDWKAEDFADDVMGYDEELDNEKEKSFSKGSNEPLPDFDTVASLDKWFDSLSFEELQELVNDIEQDIKDVVVESLPMSKQERREQFVKRLYEQGKLNQVVTKIVKTKPQMQQYFSGTKMNNKYNPLMPSKTDEYVVMFHGTPEQFNEFDTKKVGKHGSVMGSGLYFTNNYSYAEDYKEYDDGRVIATLLDIKKPLSRNKHEITREELKTFIRKVLDSNGEDFLSNYGDVYSVGYDKLLNDTVNKLFDYNTNDVDMIEDIYITSRMDFDEFHDGLTDTLGYDGVIAWNKAEGTQAIVFRSNQVKEIFNFKPTKSKDIRFSKGSLEIINLSNDNELQERIKNSNKSKYTIIRQYLIDTFVGQTITLSDGIKAIVDKSDAKHLTHLADNKKTATLSKLREVIEKAQLFSVANNVTHIKFDKFRYYEAKVSFENEVYSILLNVGRLRFQNEYHIYDITKKGSVANESTTRLARSVDYSLKNNTSTTSIRDIDEKVNTNLQKNNTLLSKGTNDGLYQKKIADISKKKVYAKKEAQEVINTVIGSIDLGNGYYVDVTTKKSVEGVINELWKVMNTNDSGKRVKASEDIADYLIDTLVRFRGIIVYQKLKVGLLCEPHLFVYLKVFVFRSIICNRNLSYRTNRRYLYINSKLKVTPQADNSNC